MEKSSVNFDSLSKPVFLKAPAIIQNPNPKVPLAAILTFTANNRVQIRVKLFDGERRWEILFDNSRKPESGLPILGMRSDREHHLDVTIFDANGNVNNHDKTLVYRTPPLPMDKLDFPPIKLKHLAKGRVEPGVTLLSVRRRANGRIKWQTDKQIKFTKQWGMILALDSKGEVVWYYKTDKRMAGFEILSNGNLFIHSNDFSVHEVDLLGNTITIWYADKRPDGPIEGAIPIKAQTIHHQPHVMPNGNFLSFTANAQKIENWHTSDYDPNAPRKTAMVMGDTIIEFTRTGETVWSWNAFDHLDPYRIGYNSFSSYWKVRGFPDVWDWTHGNGLWYDEHDDSIIVSLRLQDAIIKIDRTSKKICWILGDPTGWSDELAAKLLKPVGNVRIPYHPHNPRLTSDGTLILMDNGIFQARPFDPPILADQTFSRAVEFEIDEENMTVREVWASASELTQDSINCWAMGDAHRLPETDNILAVYALCVPRLPDLTYNEFDNTKRHVDDPPHGALIRQYARTSPPEPVLEIEISDPFDLIQWEVYGGIHLPGLYPELKK